MQNTTARQANLTLRRATLEDAERVFTWRNRPEIVALGTSQRPVTWEEHSAWFAKRVASESCLLLLALLDDAPIGQVRFDRTDGTDSCQISIYLLSEFTGLGLGVMALREACSQAFAEFGVGEILAFVREENRASLSAFRKAGFALATTPRAEAPAGHATLYLRKPENAAGEEREAA